MNLIEEIIGKYIGSCEPEQGLNINKREVVALMETLQNKLQEELQNKGKKILIFRSSSTEEYNFIQWIYGNDSIVAIVEDIESSGILQFKLSDYLMKFVNL